VPTLAFQRIGGPSGSQWSRHSFSEETPLWFGPRQWGQSSAHALAWKTAIQAKAIAHAGGSEEKSNTFWRMIDRAIKQQGAPIVTGFMSSLDFFDSAPAAGSVIISGTVDLTASRAGHSSPPGRVRGGFMVLPRCADRPDARGGDRQHTDTHVLTRFVTKWNRQSVTHFNPVCPQRGQAWDESASRLVPRCPAALNVLRFAWRQVAGITTSDQLLPTWDGPAHPMACVLGEALNEFWCWRRPKIVKCKAEITRGLCAFQRIPIPPSTRREELGRSKAQLPAASPAHPKSIDHRSIERQRCPYNRTLKVPADRSNVKKSFRNARA